jgi:hypothetical protein
MIVHLICGAEAGRRLSEAVEEAEGLAGPVFTLLDRLHHGPLQRVEGGSFAQLRAAYWNTVEGGGETQPDTLPAAVRDEEKVIEAANLLQKHPAAQIWFWMAPHAADVTAYYFLLRYLHKHLGRFYLLNIAGLPFLTEEGKVFFPQSFGELAQREFLKARRLARPVSPAEAELDSEVWPKLAAPESAYRILEGGKKLRALPADAFDSAILSALDSEFGKASKVLQTLAKQKLPTDETALRFRIQQLAAGGALQLKGDPTRPAREWEVALPQTAESISTKTPHE